MSSRVKRNAAVEAEQKLSSKKEAKVEKSPPVQGRRRGRPPGSRNKNKTSQAPRKTKQVAVNTKEVDTILSDRKGKEFFIKWKGKSYWHCTYVKRAELAKIAQAKLRNYERRKEEEQEKPKSASDDEGSAEEEPTSESEEEDDDGVNPDWTEIEKVIAVRAVKIVSSDSDSEESSSSSSSDEHSTSESESESEGENSKMSTSDSGSGSDKDESSKRKKDKKRSLKSKAKEDKKRKRDEKSSGSDDEKSESESENDSENSDEQEKNKKKKQKKRKSGADAKKSPKAKKGSKKKETPKKKKAKKSEEEQLEFLVKWKSLTHDQCTWESEKAINEHNGQTKIDEYKKRVQTAYPNPQKGDKRCQFDFVECKTQPECLRGGSLHAFQLEGLNWLLYSFSKSTNVILADEMGLGKTIQAVSYVASLALGVGGGQPMPGPYLIVAPLSTIKNWQREFATWAPSLNVVVYQGSQESRDLCWQYEIFGPTLPSPDGSDQPNPLLAQVILTTYEYGFSDTSRLRKLRYRSLVVDEGHRLKNRDAKLPTKLREIASDHRVLLTGTPLQNSVEELFNLLNFLSPELFNDLAEFEGAFASLSRDEQVTKLQTMIGPHLLRRMKSDVLKTIAPKVEVVVPVDLSSLQRHYYRLLLTKNYEALTSTFSEKSSRFSLLNVIMQLRKTCNHPYLFLEEPPAMSTPEEKLRGLIEASGKLVVLDKMLQRLKETGHRVLLFSQMSRTLDLLEDYIEARGYEYERIDGSVPSHERQEAIDRFNEPGSEVFMFLLTTKAGGLGINLQTADTVILFDSDWNPHTDRQAYSRAHRIGQSKKVMIYRFVCRKTVEERILQVASKKKMLELVVSKKMKDNLKAKELEEILRYGSAELFADEDQDARQQDGSAPAPANRLVYDDAAIESLLDRSQTISGSGSGQSAGSSSTASGGGGDSSAAAAAATETTESDEYLDSFKVAYFTRTAPQPQPAAASTSPTTTGGQDGDGTEGDEKKKGVRFQITSDVPAGEDDLVDDATDFWAKLLRDRYLAQKEAEFASMGVGKRTTTKRYVFSGDSEEDDIHIPSDASSDEEFTVGRTVGASSAAEGSGGAAGVTNNDGAESSEGGSSDEVMTDDEAHKGAKGARRPKNKGVALVGLNGNAQQGGPQQAPAAGGAMHSLPGLKTIQMNVGGVRQQEKKPAPQGPQRGRPSKVKQQQQQPAAPPLPPSLAGFPPGSRPFPHLPIVVGSNGQMLLITQQGQIPIPPAMLHQFIGLPPGFTLPPPPNPAGTTGSTPNQTAPFQQQPPQQKSGLFSPTTTGPHPTKPAQQPQSAPAPPPKIPAPFEITVSVCIGPSHDPATAVQKTIQITPKSANHVIKLGRFHDKMTKMFANAFEGIPTEGLFLFLFTPSLRMFLTKQDAKQGFHMDRESNVFPLLSPGCIVKGYFSTWGQDTKFKVIVHLYSSDPGPARGTTSGPQPQIFSFAINPGTKVSRVKEALSKKTTLHAGFKFKYKGKELEQDAIFWDFGIVDETVVDVINPPPIEIS